ncbi:MAG: hypothetical protein R3D05_19145 [Dongiaceae bacterium]
MDDLFSRGIELSLIRRVAHHKDVAPLVGTFVRLKLFRTTTMAVGLVGASAEAVG